jgi:acylphosphatase
MNMKTTSKLRQLLRNPAAKNILLGLWKYRNDKKIVVYLETSQKCVNDSIEWIFKHNPDEWSDKMLSDCYNRFDGPFFDELKNVGLIKGFFFGEGDLPDEPYDETGGGWEVASVEGLDNDKLKSLIDWVKQLPYIFDWGDLSLNTVSGIVYYKGKQTTLYKNSSYFKLLKSFLEQEKHELLVSEILQIRDVSVGLNTIPEGGYKGAKEVIKNLGRRIGIRKDLNQVFSYTGDSFVILG